MSSATRRRREGQLIVVVVVVEFSLGLFESSDFCSDAAVAVLAAAVDRPQTDDAEHVEQQQQQPEEETEQQQQIDVAEDVVAWKQEDEGQLDAVQLSDCFLSWPTLDIVFSPVLWRSPLASAPVISVLVILVRGLRQNWQELQEHVLQFRYCSPSVLPPPPPPPLELSLFLSMSSSLSWSFPPSRCGWPLARSFPGQYLILRFLDTPSFTPPFSCLCAHTSKATGGVAAAATSSTSGSCHVRLVPVLSDVAVLAPVVVSVTCVVVG